MRCPCLPCFSDQSSKKVGPGRNHSDMCRDSAACTFRIRSDKEVDVGELAGLEKPPKVLMQAAPRIGCQLEPIHFSTPDIVLHCPTKYVHCLSNDGPRMEEAARGQLRIWVGRDDTPSLGVQVKAVHIVAGVVVRCSTKYIQLAVKRNHGVTIATCWRRWTTPQDMLCADAGPCGRLEVELKQGVVFLRPRLTREDKHAVSGHSNGEVT